VSWTLTEPDEDYLNYVLPPETAVVVDRAEEHHGGVPEDALPTSGVVKAVRAVCVRYESSPRGDPPAVHPVEGSARLTPLSGSDLDGIRLEGLVGYLVELQT